METSEQNYGSLSGSESQHKTHQAHTQTQAIAASHDRCMSVTRQRERKTHEYTILE